MEIFYSNDIRDGILHLDAEEALHCVRVLRHRNGDPVDIIDGRGTLYRGTLLEGYSKGATVRIDSVVKNWHSHPYRLTLAVCPTKNPDRYEWMAEKATEVGMDMLVPVIGERSERKFVGKAARLERVLLSAAKQSLKGAVPVLAEAVSVKEFAAGCTAAEGSSSRPETLRLIAYCSDEVQPRSSIMEELREFWEKVRCSGGSESGTLPEIVVLIGPEGDFSPEEVRAAMEAGFIPVSLGESRLRTETAAVTAAEAVYLSLL